MIVSLAASILIKEYGPFAEQKEPTYQYSNFDQTFFKTVQLFFKATFRYTVDK